MGHAVHFLRRLDRLDDPHVELALRLYNDPELLAATLARAKLPDGAERVAIAIEDAREGPYVIVTRAGRFVTCLARGMSVGDTPVVTRERLDAAAREVERMREVIAQAQFAGENQGLLRKKFQALYEDGPFVTREQFEDIARWEPLLGKRALAWCTSAAREVIDARAPLKNVTRPHPRHERALHRYYTSLYTCAHLYVLSAMSPQNRSLMEKLVAGQPELTWTWAGVRSGVGYLLDRSVWATARFGRILLPGAKRRLREAVTYLGVLDGVLSTAAIGLAHDKLRAEAQKALRAPFAEVKARDPRVEPVRDLLVAVLDVCFDRPDEARRVACGISGENLVELRDELPEPYRFERVEDVPEDLALALYASSVQPAWLDADHLSGSFWHLAWLARAEARELYLPEDFIRLIRRPWRMEDTIALLEGPRSEDGVRQPRRSEKVAGRNDPCPCGSGKKHKRCCGAASSS